MLYRDFYSELGKLLYAIADFDGVITPKENKIVDRIVKRKLVPTEKHRDQFGTDVAYYTRMEFDYCDEENKDPDEAFSSFLDFLEDHKTAVDEKMKRMCVRASLELANGNYKTNKKKKYLLKMLKDKIGKLGRKGNPEFAKTINIQC